MGARIHRPTRARLSARSKREEPRCGAYIRSATQAAAITTTSLKQTCPPPDLAIEIDDSRDSRSRLPLYAALGVPEVWRYDAVKKSLWFGRLREDGTYEAIERSESLPMLTPAVGLDWMKRGENMAESLWFEQLRHWVRDELPPRAEARP
jgi:hypothetical protein